jgi:hypothetical protein
LALKKGLVFSWRRRGWEVVLLHEVLYSS